MSYKLFVREFIGSRKKLIIISSIILVFLTVVGLMWINMSVNSVSGNEADVVICGQRDDNAYGFKLYDSIENIVSAAQVMDKNNVNVVASVERNIISIQNGNSLSNITCMVKGYDEGFIDNQIVFSKGRGPESDKKEIAIGSNMAKMLGVSVGDSIGENEVEIAGIDGIGLAFTLESDVENYEYENYKVVGIIDENLKDFSYSFLIAYDEAQSTIIPNTLELYFKNEDAINEYKNFIDLCEKKQIAIPSVSERFETKKNIKSQMLMNMIFVTIFSIVVLYLLIAYLCKGIERKLGLLKSFGITNKTIVSIFAGGLSFLVVIAYIISIVLIHIICYIQNTQLSNLVGYAVNRYKYSLNVYMVQLGLCCILICCVWGIIYWIIKTTSPKLSMSK